jgi:uncharacterized membrane-anchored protein
MQESSNKVPEVTLAFWIVKVAATTLGETGGDFLDKPVDHGGLALSRPLGCLFVLPQRAGPHPGQAEAVRR